MPQYWWVNHKQTVRQEVDGGYLWAPKLEANGVRSQFYENMRRAEPGDAVLSFANGKIGFVGTVSDYAISAPKPEEFGNTGSYWSKEGWLLPVSWQIMPTPVIPKDLISDIRHLLPEKYSPINTQGNGNQKAYFAKISEDLFYLLIAGENISIPARTTIQSARALFIDSLENAVLSSIEADKSLDDTVRSQVTKARKGQGKFRDNVLKIENCCRITKVKNPDLLVASHIKPWRSCLSAEERLDGCNGLLLTRHVDHLFDQGLISFSDEGVVLISSHLSQSDLRGLGLYQRSKTTVGSFTLKQRNYLAHHRQNVFLK